MSKAEKKRKIIEQHQPSIISGSHVKRYGEVAIMKMMQAHTNQTLQELKERVRESAVVPNLSTSAVYYNKALSDAIQLIDEAKDA